MKKRIAALLTVLALAVAAMIPAGIAEEAAEIVSPDPYEEIVAEFLQAHPKVEAVHYPGLPSDPYYPVAQKYLPNGGCGVVSFELRGGRAAAERFMERLRLAAIETHVADARTCCLNPATSTHRQMNEEQLAAAGVPAGLVRMSCGLEDKEDLIADLAQALED